MIRIVPLLTVFVMRLKKIMETTQQKDCLCASRLEKWVRIMSHFSQLMICLLLLFLLLSLLFLLVHLHRLDIFLFFYSSLIYCDVKCLLMRFCVKDTKKLFPIMRRISVAFKGLFVFVLSHQLW